MHELTSFSTTINGIGHQNLSALSLQIELLAKQPTASQRAHTAWGMVALG